MKKKELLWSVTIADCKVETFTVGGAGGGGKDTSNTGVRVTHPPSGAQGIGVDHRSQFKNKQAAFARMAATKAFKAWHRIETARRMQGRDYKSVDERVEEAMAPNNLKIEGKDADGKWIDIGTEV
jgi:protein subunit release factor A